MENNLVLIFVIFLSLSTILISSEENLSMPEFTISNRTVNPLIKAERPYEEFCVGYVNVLKIEKKWHMWYLSADRNYRKDGDRYLCYATSDDGLHWNRPNLNLYNYNGSTENNILFYGPMVSKGGFGGGTIFHDEKAPIEQRFKMIFNSDTGGSWPVFSATSHDGLKWKFGTNPIMNKNSDTQTVLIQDDGIYRMYVRMWSKSNYEGNRLIGYSESVNFETFPEPKVILSPDNKDRKDLQFYGPGTSKLEKDKYVMIISGYSTEEDVVRAYLSFSKDGKNFSRVGTKPIVELGKNFDSKAIYVAPGAIPGEKPGTYWVYYIGSGTQHEENRTVKIRYAGGIGRFLLEMKEAPQEKAEKK